MSTCDLRICPGDLNVEITVQKAMTESDGQGGSLPTVWVDFFWFWGEVKWGKDKEIMVADKVEAISWATIRAYYDQRFATEHRLCFDGKILNIRGHTDVLQRHIVSLINAEEGVGT